MVAATFNAITYANKLKKAKDTNELIDMQAEELSNILSHNVATKDDIYVLRSDLKVLKIELQAFIVRCLITFVGAIGGLQILFHFLNI